MLTGVSNNYITRLALFMNMCKNDYKTLQLGLRFDLEFDITQIQKQIRNI